MTKPYIAGLGQRLSQEEQDKIPLIKVCRIRALENGEGKIHLQVLCLWLDESFDFYFESWHEFGEKITDIILNLKETK